MKKIGLVYFFLYRVVVSTILPDFQYQNEK